MAASLDPAFSSLPPDAEERLAELARAAGPLRRVVAALSGRLVARRGWEPMGHARLADYARERLGVSGRSLQEFARVDRELAALPRLEEALLSGHLPWSKVRLLARFASSRDEAGWIARAEGMRVRELERTCRAVDRGASGAECTDEEGGDDAPTAWLRIRGPLRLAFKWQATRRAASKVAAADLGAADVLELVAAEAWSGLVGAVAGEAEDEVEAGEPVAPAPAEAPAEWPRDACETTAPPPERAPLPRFLEALVAGLDCADAFELDTRLRRAIRLEQRLDAEIGGLLRHVTSAEHEWRTGYRSLAEVARECLGISPRKARALLRLERVARVCPALHAAYRDGRLSWVQAQTLAPLLLVDAEGGWRQAWIAWAGRVTARRLAEGVEHALWLRDADPRAWQRGLEDPGFIDALLSSAGETLADAERQVCAPPRERWNEVQIRVRAPVPVARLFRSVLCSVRLAIERETGRLASESDAFEAMLDHALESWGIDEPRFRRQMRRRYAIFERDGWRCTVPGCTSRRNLQSHHIVFRSAGGPDTPENQTTLCAHHHLRGVHGGAVRITGGAPDGLWFELGTRPGQPPVALYRSGERVA